MFPVILRDGASARIAAGASGGRRIMAAVLQLVLFVADFGMTPEDAAHQPRIDVSGADKVTADRRLAPDILARCRPTVRSRSSSTRVLPINFACPNLILQRGGADRHQRCGLALVGGGRAGVRRPPPRCPLRSFFNTRTGLPGQPRFDVVHHLRVIDLVTLLGDVTEVRCEQTLSSLRNGCETGSGSTSNMSSPAPASLRSRAPPSARARQ